MAGSARRAVFTGIGVISPVGSDPTAFWAALVAGKSGIRPITFTDATELPSRIAADILDFAPKKFVTNREHLKSFGKLMARTVQLGTCASQAAFNDSRLKLGEFEPERAGVEYGAGMIASELDDLGKASQKALETPTGPTNLGLWGEHGLAEVPPLWMLKYLPNMPSCHTSINLDLRGPSNTITGSDAASLLAMSEAYHILLRDGADLFIVGGTESKLNPLSMTRHNLFQELSQQTEQPETALKPFDRHRSGTVLGEAATALVLEDLDHAQKRGATIHAELVGFASGLDRQLNGDGLARVIHRALAQANITASDIDHVNAQGHGYRNADRWEANGINQVFGTKTPVWAMKPHFGATGAASNLIELLGSILALKHGQLPPTLNYHTPDPECPVHVHTDGLRPVTKPYVVKIGFTDLGQCAVAVIKKWN